MICDAIEKELKMALNTLGAKEAAFVVERPADFKHGDFATNAALVAAKALKKNPKEVAKTLASRLNIAGVEKVEVAGAGFINFYLTREALVRVVEEAATSDTWGVSELNQGKLVMVEYTDPNPFKEFHIGHLMSNAIGESVARLFEASGARVVRANYQGDVGPHVAKCLFVLLEKKIESPTLEDISQAYVEGAKRYEENAKDKTAIDVLNKTIYERTDERVNAVYEKGRFTSLKHFEELYRMLGTQFDEYFFESETAPPGLAVVAAHPKIFEKSDGAVVFHAEKYNPKLHTRVFVTSQGLPTYETKELGLVEMKLERHAFDRSVTITATEQSGYFAVLLEAIAQVWPKLRGRFEHISHGMMRFSSGKMSSRRGNVVTGESLLIDLADAAHKKMKGRDLADAGKVARQVAVGAVKYAVLRQGSGKDIVFDEEKSLSLEGDSGPYVQYARTRAGSLLREATKADIEASITDAPKEASALERTLVHYPEVVARAVAELEPHYVATYLTELASAFNSWYSNGRVIGGTHPHYGTLLAQATERTLRAGLGVLGIPVPEEM